MKFTPLRVLAIFLVLGILALLVVGGEPAYQRKEDEDHLRFLADIIIKAEHKDHALPVSIDAALESTDTTLLSRSEVAGVSYWRFDDHAFLMRSIGENKKLEGGQGDDVDICYLSGREISRAEMIDYLKKTKPDAWEADVWVVTGKIKGRSL